MYMCKKDLVLNNLQGLMYYKAKPIKLNRHLRNRGHLDKGNYNGLGTFGRSFKSLLSSQNKNKTSKTKNETKKTQK